MENLLKFLQVLLSNTPEQMSMPAFLPWRDLRAQEEQVYPPHLALCAGQQGGGCLEPGGGGSCHAGGRTSYKGQRPCRAQLQQS